MMSPKWAGSPESGPPITQTIKNSCSGQSDSWQHVRDVLAGTGPPELRYDQYQL